MRIVFTGGPGTGKTSVIDRLKELGYKIIDEPARTILEDINLNTPDLHPKLSKENRNKFQIAVENKNYEGYTNNTYGFFDRSAIDEVGFRHKYKVKISEDLNYFCKNNRYDLIFFFPFWKEIYKNDNVRGETPEEAEKIGRVILDTYLKYGYDPLIVPKMSLELRLDYIINNILSFNKDTIF